MAVPLAQPPGAHSCRDGGTWDHARRSHLEGPYLIEELHAFREELYLSNSDWEDFLAEVSSLLRKAEKGRLNFDSRPTSVSINGLAHKVLQIALR